MERILRNFFLFLSKNRFFTKLAKRYGLRFGAGKFVAGETVPDAVKTIQELNDKGMSVTIDHLGEFIDSESEAREAAENCIKAVEAIAEHKLDSQLSLKLTSMGLDISEGLVMENMRRILDVAQEKDVFVTIDMEDYERCEKTLSIFKSLRNDYEHIGTVLQSYLYRTVGDIEDLNQYHPNLRLVKGAYKESPKVAFPDKKDVDDNLKKIIRIHLLHGNYTAIASHDDEVIEYTKKLVKENNISRDLFEFQMLFGIRVERQKELVKEGYKVRVYVPYGNDWYGYFMRRLAERPANIAFVLKGVWGK
ncbi:L-proline dehydrogenase [Halobacillus karajensis]|uniref:proline dehydrogenase n=1 Tax=Halobacillus karajensis TaxID=195088 RepID=A0A024P306_9BACI|nr:proline dehydrogenase [Halobacillus karajensis]CDQ19317.1 Proline dehydrogenase 1 [Halobacillus karajensis]CDQ22520.1 Proline dehydrogenase 1 [Halobacillus karajensis]CDQ26002.1 Proline dehydrogenase 1 [Halobacillus karajensis]SEH38405.1 L-proline dehydrogenase [Halobacillus karajensis]